MKRNRTQLHFVAARVLLAAALIGTGVWLTHLSVASSPSAALTFGGPDPTVPGNPRYQTFYAPAGTSAEPGSGEFNIGFDPITHRIMTMNTGPVWRLTPPEILVPAKPECCEALWEDKSAHTTNTGLDPILWTDQKTGRTFISNSTAGANFVYGYTDAAAPFNDGDMWVEAGISPPNGGVDHETLGSGPFPASLSALSNGVNHGEYVLYCSQDAVGSQCQRSIDLGMMYGPGVAATGPGAMNSQGCGGLHGHVHVAPDGTAWLPDNSCGGGRQGGAFSLDAGTTPWTEFSVHKDVSDADGAAFNTSSQANGADPSIGIDSANTVYYCYVNNEGNGEGHVHVAVGKRNGSTVNWLRDADLSVSHGLKNAAENEAVAGSAGRAACGFLGTNVADSPGSTYENGNFQGIWYVYIATTYDEGRTWVVVNATPNDPVQNHTGIWQQGGSGENGDRNLLDFNEITIDDKGRVLYGYSDGCHTETCIHGDNLGSSAPPDQNRGPYLERGAFMRVARQSGGKTLLESYDANTDTTTAKVPKPACLSATRDCSGGHLTWKAPDNGGADITGYAILRGTTAGSETVLVTNTGNTNTTFDDPVDSSVRHYFYVVKGINSQGAGIASNEVDASSVLIASDDAVTVPENVSSRINALANDCGAAPLTVTSATAPAHGTANVNGDGTITYLPTAGYFGPDTFTYTLHNGLGATTTATVNVTVNATCSLVNTGSFSDDFESGAPGWTVETPKNNIPASLPWTLVADASAHSPTHSFKSDTTTLDLKDDRLISPPQKLSSTSHLKFWHRYQFEDGFDGGAVEVSTDGGATWVDVLAGGGNFVTGGYNGIISPSYGSPIAGRPAWTGGDATAAMSQVDIDLGAYAGLNVRIRFRAACDMFLAGSQPGVGWFIDDVQFTNTVQEGPCPNVVSRKTHGTAGDFDVALPLSGTPGLECRSGGSSKAYTLIYTLGGNVAAPGTATVRQGSADVGTPTLGPGPNQITLNLTGVTNIQHLVVVLNGVQAAGAILDNLVARMDVLLGDIDASRRVDSSDVFQVRQQSLQTASPLNFRMDVDASGRVDSTDVFMTRQQSLTALP